MSSVSTNFFRCQLADHILLDDFLPYLPLPPPLAGIPSDPGATAAPVSPIIHLHRD